jgi:hypothetical protein
MPRVEHAQIIVLMFRGVAQGEEAQLWLKRQSLRLSTLSSSRESEEASTWAQGHEGLGHPRQTTQRYMDDLGLRTTASP